MHAFADITAVFSLPEAYRKRLRTSNSIERLVGSFLIEQHERWISGKVYFTMDAYWLERDQARTKADLIRHESSRNRI